MVHEDNDANHCPLPINRQPSTVQAMIPISYYLILSAIVFLTGVVGVLIRRNIIAILLSVELMLNATNINFVAFSDHLQDLGGQVFVFFALTVAAAEVAVGLAIIIALHRSRSTINVEEFNLLKW
jgi:NADH-quinone oxidoreductase subunit K